MLLLTLMRSLDAISKLRPTVRRNWTQFGRNFKTASNLQTHLDAASKMRPTVRGCTKNANGRNWAFKKCERPILGAVKCERPILGVQKCERPKSGVQKMRTAKIGRSKNANGQNWAFTKCERPKLGARTYSFENQVRGKKPSRNRESASKITLSSSFLVKIVQKISPTRKQHRQFKKSNHRLG